MERWEERLRARSRLRKAAAERPWLRGVRLGDESVVVTVAAGAHAAASTLVEALSLGVRIDVLEEPAA